VLKEICSLVEGPVSAEVIAVDADGMVREGESAVDESMLTGEAIPVAKAVGAELTGGTVNGTGALLMEARRVGSETLLAQIVKLVSEAQRSRAPVQRVRIEWQRVSFRESCLRRSRPL